LMVTKVSQCYIVSRLFNSVIVIILHFELLGAIMCHIVSQCDICHAWVSHV
jgi:hypothetical protein